jgi:enoyl-CoA hydratase/carnithine racemase
VNHVYPDDQILAEARRLAERLLAKDALSIAMTKSATNAMARLMVPDEASHAEREQMLLAYMMRRRHSEEPGGGD